MYFRKSELELKTVLEKRKDKTKTNAFTDLNLSHFYSSRNNLKKFLHTIILSKSRRCNHFGFNKNVNA